MSGQVATATSGLPLIEVATQLIDCGKGIIKYSENGLSAIGSLTERQESHSFHIKVEGSNPFVHQLLKEFPGLVSPKTGLHQLINSDSVPVGFYSKKLSEARRKYSTYDRELLAAYLSVLHFKHIIERQAVPIFPDHRLLAEAFRSSKETISDRQQRYLSVITENVQHIQYIK
nr:uncharacterized protein LOC121128834 [Lepeophtheirus salmonis]